MPTKDDVIDRVGGSAAAIEGAATALKATLQQYGLEGEDFLADRLAVFTHGLEGIAKEMQATYETLNNEDYEESNVRHLVAK